MRCPVLVLPLLLIFCSPALASDGVLEISQTCAVQTGCFAGDTAGFPVTIRAPGSFQLTSNLTVPDENTDAIVVNASDVGIDLNDFAILGPVVCTVVSGGLVCTPASGTGSGVERLGTVRGVSVKNGSITGMGNDGVLLGDQTEIENLRVRSNRVQGINVGSGGTLSGNAAYQNGGDGILASAAATISGNASFGNGGSGIVATLGSTVSGNAARSNGGDGINVASGSSVQDNVVTENLGSGIFVNFGSAVQRNVVEGNGGFGLLFGGTQSTYRENTITLNLGGSVSGAGLNLGNNSCNGTTTCP